MGLGDVAQLVRSVTTAPAGRVASDRLEPGPPARAPVYVKFLLAFDYPAEFDPFAAVVRKSQVILRPGERRTVVLTAVVMDEEDSESVCMRTDGLVLLVAKPSEIPAPLNFRRTIPLASIKILQESFEIEIPQTAESGNLKLTLWFAAGLKHSAQPAAILEAEIKGEDRKHVLLFREALGVRLDARPPSQVAIVHVAAPQEGKLELILYIPPEEPQQTAIFDRPDLKLEEWVRTREHPRNIRNYVRQFCQHDLPDLFLKAVMEFFKTGEGNKTPHVLIVCDHANSEIPWEMVEIEDNFYLGAMVELVRWIPVRMFAKTCPLILEETCQTGRVLAFRNGPHVEGSHTDREVLQKSLGCVPDDDWSDLAHRITSMLGVAGLVYFYCHGTHDFQEVERWYLQPETCAADGFPIVEFNEIPEQFGQRPLFFINACHSGRLIRKNGTPYGLATILLARVASGFIGTLGSVQADIGARIAGDVFSRLQAPTGEASARPSEVLRQLRAEAAVKIHQKPTQDDWNRFLFICMYVYYGNPFLRVGLRPGDTPKRGER